MSILLLLNSTICFAIAVISLTFAWVLAKNENLEKQNSKPTLYALITFWLLVSFTYYPTALRMIAAYLDNAQVDIAMYYIASIPFAFVSVPVAYFIIYVITGNKQASSYVSIIFAMFGASYLMFLLTNRVVEPLVTYWSSIININSNIAINIYLIGLFVIPTAMILGILLLILLRKISKKIRYRTVLLLVSISFVIDFMLTDMITTFDMLQFVARIFVLIGTVLAYISYFPPPALQERLGIYQHNFESCDEAEYMDLEEDIDV
ncbi:hypothetical protein [Methanococcoides burtonii]|uniref:Uncharacterized protein n=1 Tax=Methanococcoides burtonii (strain DSM 6242 / NBRC 107633 / OCM 468 / ACE-M) TaxID=259564 RepID=Q12ZK3_METBU|nr:hypothetical protein [Methanococcoides burtonii]ABE51123.1 Hypothetical protein Mbur_0105 [Methanococcoides burtonii DSM 6242]